jgi:hypothetical protein
MPHASMPLDFKRQSVVYGCRTRTISDSPAVTVKHLAFVPFKTAMVLRMDADMRMVSVDMPMARRQAADISPLIDSWRSVVNTYPSPLMTQVVSW